MAIPVTGLIGQQSKGDGFSDGIRQDKFGAIVTHEAYGKHFENTLRGNGFVYTIAGQALLLAATTGGHPTILNPVGSGVIFVPTALRISFVSGTTVIGSVVLAETLSIGAGAATAAAVLTATLVDAKSSLRGAGSASRVKWSPTTNTFTAAPTVVLATGLNLGAASPTGTGAYETKLDGSLAFYPGTAMSVCYSVTTSTALFTISILGIEVPLPSGS